jgi:DNA-directed RNA polymerase subunit beta'
MEARVLMMSTNNILSPASGKPIINPTQDIVLGLYYMTRERPFARGEYKEGAEKKGDFRGCYSSAAEVRMAYDSGEIDLHAKIKVRYRGKLHETTVGRTLLTEILPDELSFDLVNKVLDKKALSRLIEECYRVSKNKNTVLLADRLRTMGFEMSTQAGISICMDDMTIPDSKKSILGSAQGEVEVVVEQYQEGLITDGERYNKVVDIWAAAADEVARDLIDGISKDVLEDHTTGEKKETASFNPIYMMADSGARGSNQQIRQLAGMRGLMAKPSGEIIETPITANFREGLTVLAVLHLDARRPQGSRGYGAQNRRLRLPHASSRGRGAGRRHHGVRLRHARRHLGVRSKRRRNRHHAFERILGRVALEDIVDPSPATSSSRRNEEIKTEGRRPSKRRASSASSSARCSPARLRVAASARSATAATFPRQLRQHR